MNTRKAINSRRNQRKGRTRAKISGTSQRPRLVVFRSNRYFYAQLVDDESGRTIAAVSAKDLQSGERQKPKKDQAVYLGEMLAKKAQEKNITQAVFDRRSYAYHGRVAAFAESARRGGLKI